MTVEFKAWGKTPRWFRDVTVTEKIDGTNAAVHIVPVTGIVSEGEYIALAQSNQTGQVYGLAAQSRKRLITPDDDNAGFARFVHENSAHLVEKLGPGLHFGEYWGQGIQRKYGMDRKIFSLFNTAKWGDVPDVEPDDAGLAVVPVLYEGPLQGSAIDLILEGLAWGGSHAAPGFMRPEGVCIYHHASRQVYKALIDGDDLPKSVTRVGSSATGRNDDVPKSVAAKKVPASWRSWIKEKFSAAR